MTCTDYLCFAFALALAPLAACSDNPSTSRSRSASGLKAKSNDVTGTAISEQKGITTESGNPYSAFITEATGKLGGHAPAASRSTSSPDARRELQHVVALEEVMTGDVDVAFITNDTNNTYDVGHVMNPVGVGFRWVSRSASTFLRSAMRMS